MSKKECNHIIGFEYEDLITISDLKNDFRYYHKKLQSDIYQCKYCPSCGIKLDEIVPQTITQIKEDINKAQKLKEE